MGSYESFDEAKGLCPEGHQICGAMTPDGPRYFTMPADAEDEEIRDVAFEIRHGRPIGVERDLDNLAKLLIGTR